MKPSALLLVICWVVPGQAIWAEAIGSNPTAASPPAVDSLDYYDQRYALDDPFQKRIDNHGNGFDALYGTRNFREVLKGVAYRGGANNKWHRDARRDNRNPLPDDGLQNLCAEGFGRSFYLYRTNFSLAPQHVECASRRGGTNRIDYLQRSPNHPDEAYDVLQAVHETIADQGRGPVYVHCWNGWHASGLMAAQILRQFCGYSADEAVAYWDRNTDGHNSEPKYERIRQRIRDFEPYPEFAISDAEAARICPTP